MLNHSTLRLLTRGATSSRAVSLALRTSQSTTSRFTTRPLHISAILRKNAEDAVREGEAVGNAGAYSRTDKTIQVEYPSEGDLPSSKPVQGRGGYHFKRTLASFSLEGGVCLVTGGARGLGLVMSQAAVISGADVAIVDLNRK